MQLHVVSVTLTILHIYYKQICLGNTKLSSLFFLIFHYFIGGILQLLYLYMLVCGPRWTHKPSRLASYMNKQLQTQLCTPASHALLRP